MLKIPNKNKNKIIQKLKEIEEKIPNKVIAPLVIVIKKLSDDVWKVNEHLPNGEYKTFETKNVDYYIKKYSNKNGLIVINEEQPEDHIGDLFNALIQVASEEENSKMVDLICEITETKKPLNEQMGKYFIGLYEKYQQSIKNFSINYDRLTVNDLKKLIKVCEKNE